jgi:hypothetical protein
MGIQVRHNRCAAASNDIGMQIETKEPQAPKLQFVEIILPCFSSLFQFIQISIPKGAMATMPDQFQGAFQAIAIDVIDFSSNFDPAQDMSGLQLNSSALLNRILIRRSEDSFTPPVFSVSRTATKPCNTAP